MYIQDFLQDFINHTVICGVYIRFWPTLYIRCVHRTFRNFSLLFIWTVHTVMLCDSYLANLLRLVYGVHMYLLLANPIREQTSYP